MHSRASRKRRIRDGAWALFVALLPAAESWAADKVDDSSASPDATPAATTADVPVNSTSVVPRFRRRARSRLRGFQPGLQPPGS